jgi:hypothetical protein
MMKHIVLSAALVACLGGGPPSDDPMTVTTDTPEYCLGLAGRMDSQGPMTPNARVLWERGRTLCEHGHIRSGLARLRRAMLVMRGAAE